MPSVELSVALAQARTFLNDTNATVWTDANLIPSMQQADQELQMFLWQNGSPVIRSQTGPLLVPAGYSPNINANLPNDFLIPTLGWECGQVAAVITAVAVSGAAATYSYSSSTGTGTITTPVVGMTATITGMSHAVNNVTGIVVAVGSGTFTLVTTTQITEIEAGVASMPDNQWIPLTEQFFLPLGYVLALVLTWWSWQEEALLFSGSTVNRYVNFQYRRQIPIPTAATSEIGITFGEMYLGARGAAIAAGSVGNAAAATILDGIAKENFSLVLSANRGQQKPINKPGM
jgi:hypothetical protein